MVQGASALATGCGASPPFEERRALAVDGSWLAEVGPCHALPKMAVATERYMLLIVLRLWGYMPHGLDKPVRRLGRQVPNLREGDDGVPVVCAVRQAQLQALRRETRDRHTLSTISTHLSCCVSCCKLQARGAIAGRA